MAKKAKLLWIDLEMTGLSPELDRILEVACVFTDWQLNVIDTYQAVVKVCPRLIKRRMVGEFWDQNAAVRDALIAQNSNGTPKQQVESEIIGKIKQHFSKDVYLAGNSIHQDRKFIDREWPELASKLHYRMLDVSSWKIYFTGALKRKFVKPEAHRALDDILGSIEELKYYRGFIK